MTKSASDLARVVDKYFDQVLSGKRIAGQSERLAIERHLADLKSARRRGLEFDWRFADLAVQWFHQLKFARGVAAGEQFKLQPCQQAFVSVLHGWRRKSDGLRRFRRAFISMARGNGKSPIAAGLATELFLSDVPFQPGAEVVSVATTRKQSCEYVWLPACEFLRPLATGELADHLKITRDEITLKVDGTVGKFYALGSDSSNLDGGSYHAAVIDEIHAMREKHREMLEKIRTGMKSKQQLLIVITTAGNDRSLLWIPEYDYAQKVLQGVVQDDQYFAWIFEIDKEDDPFDESVWIKANPLLGSAISIDDIRAEAKRAKANPVEFNQFVRYKCNRRVSAREKAFPPELWQLGAKPLAPLAGRRCHGGFDVGYRSDIAAVALAFPFDSGDPEQPGVDLLVHGFVPREGRRNLDEPLWQSLIAAGVLTVTDGDVTDHQAIKRYIRDAAEKYQLLSIAADPNNARTILTDLQTGGITTYEFRQSCENYHEPIQRMLDLLAIGGLRHGNCPLLKWTADNVILRSNAAGLVMPDKAKSVEKIDPMCASLMAISEMLFSEENGSVYDERDVRFV